MIATMALNYAPPSLAPSRRPLGRRRLVLVLLSIAGAILACTLPFGPTGISRTRLHEEVDLTSGRLRRTDYVLFFRTRQRVQETPLPLSNPNPPAPATTPNWYLSRALADGHSILPHWGHRSPVGQVRALDVLFYFPTLTTDARQQVAATVLSLWQSPDGFRKADDYIKSIEAVAVPAMDDPSRRLTAADLPPRPASPDPPPAAPPRRPTATAPMGPRDDRPRPDHRQRKAHLRLRPLAELPRRRSRLAPPRPPDDPKLFATPARSVGRGARVWAGGTSCGPGRAKRYRVRGE